ncbi:MAG: iron-containing alcohol dehydrogenase [Armatimonadetes bacterium]|nr:iron-containing alcohol dehydrogenase [Armatimonadota bacterium]
MTLRSTFDDNSVEVVAGEGALAELPALIADVAEGPVFVVCGASVSRQPWFTELVEALPEATVFAEVEPDPSDSTVARAGAAAAQAGAALILGLGGGSSMDAAKAIAAEAVAPGWIAAQDRPGEPTQIEAPPLPIVLVPTTAGTGSEVTPFSVITFTQTRRKLVLNHPSLYARYAVLDPTVLPSAPTAARVAAGLDALTHAVESFASKRATPQTRARAFSAIAEIRTHLPGAAAEPPSLTSLARLQWAAMVAGLAFSHTRLGVVHALALPLSALFGVPHGVANAILLPYGMRYNAPAAEEVYADIGRALGLEGSTAELAAAAAEAVRELAVQVGAPVSMAEAGVEEQAIADMAAEAIKSAHIKVNPRPLELDDLVEVYRQAMHGQW